MSDSSFEHLFQLRTRGAWTLLLLHGTGGDEHSLVSIASQLCPEANLLAIRGKVLENGAPRFFRRFEEGKLDVEDWRFRSMELAHFIRVASARYQIQLEKLVAIGYSNGANIATGLVLNQPDTLAGAVLFRPMFVAAVMPPPDLKGKKIFIARGTHDPLETAGSIAQLMAQFESAGAAVHLHEENSGHRLDSGDFQAAKEWLDTSFI